MPGYGFELMAGNESAPDNQKRIAAFRRDGLTLAGRTVTTSTITTAFAPRRACPASAKMSCSRCCAISKRASVSAPASRPWRTPCLTSTTPTCRRCRATWLRDLDRKSAEATEWGACELSETGSYLGSRNSQMTFARIYVALTVILTFRSFSERVAAQSKKADIGVANQLNRPCNGDQIHASAADAAFRPHAGTTRSLR